MSKIGKIMRGLSH